MSDKLRTVLIVVVILVSLALTFVLVDKYVQKRNAEEEVKVDDQSKEFALQLAFVRQYGVDAELVQINQPTEIYVFYWKDSENMTASMLVDSIWVDIARVPVMTNEE